MRGLPPIPVNGKIGRSGVPRRMVACLNWFEEGAIAQANPGFYTITFNINSPYLFVAAGGQPQGFDQLSSLYKRCRVLRSRVELTGINRGADMTTITLTPNIGGVPCTTSNEAMNRPLQVHKVLAEATSGRNAGTIYLSLDLEKYIGKTYLDTDWTCTYNSAAAKNVQVDFVSWPVSARAAALDYSIKIAVECEFTEPRGLPDA